VIDEAQLKTLDAQQLRDVVRSLMGELQQRDREIAFKQATRLSLGAGVDGGFVSARKGSPSEEDRAAFEAWLRHWPGVQSVEVGQLRDAWYDEPPKSTEQGRRSGSIEGFIGVLAGKADRRASVDELNEAAAQDWAGQAPRPQDAATKKD